MKISVEQYQQILKNEFSEIYFQLGASLHASQSLEFTLKFILYILSGLKLIDFDTSRAENIMDNSLKQTAGQVLNVLKNHIGFSDEDVKTLDEALNARNQLVHRFLLENADRLSSKEERAKMALEIKELGSKIIKGDEFFQKAMEAFVPVFENGKTYEEIVFESLQEFEY